jgi:hypothetical protein
MAKAVIKILADRENSPYLAFNLVVCAVVSFLELFAFFESIVLLLGLRKFLDKTLFVSKLKLK